MNLPHAAPVEYLQLLLGVGGVGVTFWRLWIAIEITMAVTVTEPSDLRRLIAETQVLGELFRLFSQGCLMIIGIVSVLLPPVSTADVPLQLTLTRIMLIVLSAALILDSLMQEWRRRQFMARL